LKDKRFLKTQLFAIQKNLQRNVYIKRKHGVAYARWVWRSKAFARLGPLKYKVFSISF